jgi:catechol 2,3-dioxygenase-like lactoylglutathione lyase family enzyme
MEFQKYKFFLFTEDPDQLVHFYHDVLGFRIIKKLEFEADYGYTLEIAPGYEMWLAKHSEVHGFSKEPVRTMLNIYVDSVSTLYEKLKDRTDITFLQVPRAMSDFVPNETRYVLTLLDPEGNCMQFMGPN